MKRLLSLQLLIKSMVDDALEPDPKRVERFQELVSTAGAYHSGVKPASPFASVKPASPISEAPSNRSTQRRAALPRNRTPMILPIAAQSDRQTREAADIIDTRTARFATLPCAVAVTARTRSQAFGLAR